MPRIPFLQTNFTAGELSPKLQGRTDFAKYYNGASLLSNFVIDEQGGIRKRPGFYTVQNTKSDGEARLIPFIFSSDEAYVLEFGPSYVRFYSAHGQIIDGDSPYEIVSPYTTIEQVRAIQFIQSGDRLFLFHPSFAPRALDRHDHTDWVLSTIDFGPPPLRPGRDYLATGCTPSAATGDITLTLDDGLWLNGDPGRIVHINGGVCCITTYLSSTVVEAAVIQTLTSTTKATSGDWYVEGSGVAQVGSIAQSLLRQNGVDSIGMSQQCFRSSHVNKYIAFNDGVGRIISVINSGTAKIVMLVAATSTDPTYLWDFYENAWDTGLYPSCGGLFEDRLWLTGLLDAPLAVHASVSGDWYNFALGALDDHALQFEIAGHQVDKAHWLATSKQVICGTPAGEFMVGGGTDPVTPSNVRARSETALGSEPISPIKVGSVFLMLQKGGRRIRELVYSFELDSIVAPDLTVLAEHITQSGIKEWAYCREPDSIVWACRNDGVFIGLTYNRAEQVVGWHRHTMTNGEVESVCTIPYDDRDELWAVIKRTINGSTVRTVEYLRSQEITDLEDAFYVDGGLTYTGPAADNFSGLSHLEGETVQILADGKVHRPLTVSGGQITLDFEATKVHIGLGYTAEFKSLYLEPAVGQVVNVVQSRTYQVYEAVLRLLDTSYVEAGVEGFDYQPVPLRTPAMLLGEMPFVSRDVLVPLVSDPDLSTQFKLRSNLPVPAQVVGIFYHLSLQED